MGAFDNCRYPGQPEVLSTTVGAPDNWRSHDALPKIVVQKPNQFSIPRGHSIVKNMGGWLDSLGSGILVEKIFWGSSKILIWTNVRG